MAVLTTDGRHANPHGTVHGAVFYAVAGAAVAAAANDDEHSGIISSVLVEYLQPAALGDVLYAEVSREVSTDREDIFTGTVRRGRQGDLLAWVRARGTRRARPGYLIRHGPLPLRPSEPSLWLVAVADGRICGNHVIDARAPGLRVEVMHERHVVIVAFDGIQPLDAVGPHEVFAGAGRAAAALGPRPAATGSPSPRPPAAPCAPRAASCWDTCPSRSPSERIDTLVLAGGTGADAAAGDEALLAWIRRAAPRCRRVATVCSGAFIGAAAGPARRTAGHHPLGPRRASSREAYPDAHASTPTRSTSATGSTGPAPGVTAGIDLSLALVQEDLGVDVAQTVARWLVMFLHRPGRPDPVRLAGLGPARRALDRPGRADPRRGRARRRPPPPGPGRGGRHERAPLHPGLHGRGGRVAQPLRRAHAPGGGPPRARETTRHARRRRRRAAASGSAETLRRVFQRHLGVSPDAYRRRFRPRRPGEDPA